MAKNTNEISPEQMAEMVKDMWEGEKIGSRILSEYLKDGSLVDLRAALLYMVAVLLRPSKDRKQMLSGFTEVVNIYLKLMDKQEGV